MESQWVQPKFRPDVPVVCAQHSPDLPQHWRSDEAVKWGGWIQWSQLSLFAGTRVVFVAHASTCWRPPDRLFDSATAPHGVLACHWKPVEIKGIIEILPGNVQLPGASSTACMLANSSIKSCSQSNSPLNIIAPEALTDVAHARREEHLDGQPFAIEGSCGPTCHFAYRLAHLAPFLLPLPPLPLFSFLFLPKCSAEFV